MAKLKDVTIIIPVYCPTEQSVEWFHECLSSCLTQGCAVVAVDDNSPQRVDDVVKLYAHDKNFAYYRYTEPLHRGVAIARNLAVDIVGTQLLLPIDCDDMFVPNAVAIFMQHWRGQPLYSDVEYFGDRVIPHFNLKEFSCIELARAVSLASVNVLHSVQQHHQAGRWNEQISLYEDGEYNSRLFGDNCATRIPLPLIRWRQHSGQRSKQEIAAQAARDIMPLIRKNVMGRKCCGSGDTPIDSGVQQSGVNNMTGDGRPQFFRFSTTIPSLPGAEEDLVDALYIGGKGKATHYYRGRVTQYNYSVVHGEVIKADKRDTVNSPEDFQKGLLVYQAPAKAEGKPAGAPTFFRPSADAPPTPEQQVKSPVEEEQPAEHTAASGGVADLAVGYGYIAVRDEQSQQEYDVPRVENMSLGQVKAYQPTAWEAAQMLRFEQDAQGKKRKGHIAYLTEVANAVE